MFKIIRKADIVLFVLLVIMGIGLSVPGFMSSARGASEASDLVEISVAGELYGTYELSKDAEIDLSRDEHVNKIIIKDNSVHMAFSSCHNQICVHQGTINKRNQSIICLPNRVVVRIAPAAGASEGGEPDVISG